MPMGLSRTVVDREMRSDGCCASNARARIPVSPGKLGPRIHFGVLTSVVWNINGRWHACLDKYLHLSEQR